MTRFERNRDDDFPKASDQLERRLASLSWPNPPTDVRDRCLEAILSVTGAGRSPVTQSGPIERAHRYEATRRRMVDVARGSLPSPRLQPRFATRL